MNVRCASTAKVLQGSSAAVAIRFARESRILYLVEM
jgi:hypothetical protein